MAGEVVESDSSPAESNQAISSQVVEIAGRDAVAGSRTSWFDQEMPYEVLVENIQHLVDRARTSHRPTAPDPFNPAEWLGEEILVMAREHQNSAEEQQRYGDLLNAWDALAYTRYTSGSGSSMKWSESARRRLENYVHDSKQTSLTLPPSSSKALDAMAEVAGIPRKKGEATIDLTPFTKRNSWRQESTWFEPEMPYNELVGEMRQQVARAQASHPQDAPQPFSPAAAFGANLERLAAQEYPDQQRYIDLSVAWDALAYPHYPTEIGVQRDKEWGRSRVESHVNFYNRTSFTLPPESTRVLDAMAEAAGLPRKRGEATIDLTPFAKAAATPRSQIREIKSIPRRILR
jgi:hypothetical protein